MIQQTQGKIFLAEQRGFLETATCQSRLTFNFEHFRNEHKHAFGNLYLLNDHTLAANGSVTLLVKETSFMLLVPVAGAIDCKQGAGAQSLAAAGQVLMLSATENEIIEVSNPFTDHWVNFLQIGIETNSTAQIPAVWLHTYNDVNAHVNSLVNIIDLHPGADNLPFSVSLGKFSGRGEMVYRAKNNSAVFLFVVNGAFEADGRLLHAGDGLGLWDADTIEMEALSNDAIIFMITLHEFV